jgi:N-acetylmuramoyl-L-alanine amidase
LVVISRIAISLILLSLLVSGATPEEKRIAIFSRVTSYSLPIIDVGGQEYSGFLEVLEPLGTVSAKADNKHWKLRYNHLEIEFTPNETRVRINGSNFELGSPFLMQNGRGLVPVSSLGPLLSRTLGGPVTFNPASRRIFIGNVAVHFTAQILTSQVSTGPTLVMNFSAPVNPTIATDASKLHMSFAHDPIVPSGTQTLTFNNQAISSAIYEEGNGAAEITIIGASPLFAKFSDDRKTITIAGAPAVAAQAPASASTPAPEATIGAVPAAAPRNPGTPSPLVYFAVVDASHGGDDRGAALTSQLDEKDVTLTFGRRLRQELESRGLTTLLLRDGDTSLSLDQRAGMSNAAHPMIYLCVHVTSQGNGVRLYTALLPSSGGTSRAFLDWDTAQAPSLARSQSAVALLAKGLEDSKIPARTMSAPLRPLNNITTAAIAIEISPPASGPAGLGSTEYQQSMASSIATAMSFVRRNLGSAP